MLLTNLTAATMRDGYGLIPDAAVLVEDGRIAWVRLRRDAPKAPVLADAHGGLVMPGLIDCHTHPVFAGNRAKEFCMRLDGKTYQEIAAAGGGIKNSTTATRAASEAELLAGTMARLNTFLSHGVTTVEANLVMVCQSNQN